MEAVGQLTGGIAHDFNNVLTVISGNLRLITEMFGDELSADAREMVTDALSADDDGAQLTTRLLSFSRTPGPDHNPLDLNQVIADFVALMKRTLGNGIDVGTRLAEVLARATEPFFTTKGLGEGSGLGLSMVYDFISECGGDLQISSTPGTGTTVVLYLPLQPVRPR